MDAALQVRNSVLLVEHPPLVVVVSFQFFDQARHIVVVSLACMDLMRTGTALWTRA
jgi:hypothetical protein